MTPRKLIQYTIYSVYSEKVLLLIWKRFLFRSKNFSKKKRPTDMKKFTWIDLCLGSDHTDSITVLLT